MKNHLRILASLVAASTTLSAEAHAGEQPKCKIPAFIQSGISTAGGYVEKQKSSAVGSPLKKGGVLFYIAIADAQKYYMTKQPVVITDASPISPNFKIEPGKKYPVSGTLTLDNADRDTFDLVDISTGLFAKALIPVRPDHYVCSDLIGKGMDGRLSSIGMPTAEQDEPLEMVVEELSNGKTRAASVVVKDFDEATATLEVTGMTNGAAVTKVPLTVDLFAGKIELGKLVIEIKRVNGQVRITSIREPADYAVWMKQRF